MFFSGVLKAATHTGEQETSWKPGLRTSCELVSIRVSNPDFTEPVNPGYPGFFSNPKTRVLAACKPGFSGLNLTCTV